MELEGVGARCAHTNCGVYDYLPIRCDGCGESFCNAHSERALHSCLSLSFPASAPGTASNCPRCGVPVRAAVLREHLRTGCAPRPRTDPVCNHSSCTARLPTAVTCTCCNRAFCIEHRLPEDHGCAAMVAHVEEGGRRRGKKLEGDVVKLKKVDKRPGSTRLTAVGDDKVAEEERVTLHVHFARSLQVAPCWMFFSKRHSAGKIADEISSRVHEMRAEQGVRWSLYAVKPAITGVNLLPHITPLRDLPHSVITDGDALVVENTPDGLPLEWHAVFAPKKRASTPLSSLPSRPAQGASTPWPSRKKFSISSKGAKYKESCAIM